MEPNELFKPRGASWEVTESSCVTCCMISAYMGGADGNGNVETREVLEPLAEMADRLRIAVVAVTHLNKGRRWRSKCIEPFRRIDCTMCAPFQTRAHMDNPRAHEETGGAEW